MPCLNLETGLFMPTRESEALILRSYPYQEAGLIVVFMTRDRGKLRGVARGVRGLKSTYGASLERLSHSHMHYEQKDSQELVKIKHAELLGSSRLFKSDYTTTVILDAIADTADRLLIDEDPNEGYFRLMLHILDEIQACIDKKLPTDQIEEIAKRVMLYFLMWSMRINGWLPPLDCCIESGQNFSEQQPAYFSPQREGLYCGEFRDPYSRKLSSSSRSLATALLSDRLDKLDQSIWQVDEMSELLLFQQLQLETQIEGHLKVVRTLKSIWCRAYTKLPGDSAD